MPRKSVSPEKRRTVRTGLAKLKKAGILSPRFNVRSAPVTAKNERLLKEYSGILDGRLKTVKLPKAKVKLNAEDGLKTVRDRVIIENTPGAKVIRKKNDPYGFEVRQELTGGIRAVTHQGGANSLAKYAEKAANEISKGNLVGFTIEGHRSRLLYNSVDQAVAASMKYKERGLIKAFTIYQVPRSQAFQWRGKQQKKKRRRK